MELNRNGIDTAAREIEELFSGLSGAQMQWQPAAGTWSILQNLEHLDLTARRMMEAMDAGCAQGPAADASSQPWRPGIFARWFLHILEPPVKMKVKTTRPFDPPPQRPAETVIAGFRESHRRLLDKLPEYAGYDQNRVRVVSPFQSAIKYKLGTALAILPAHLRRHAGQIRQLKNLPAFPKA
jgi:hypothetical protein